MTDSQQSSDAPEIITIPTETALDLLDKLRMAAIWCGPKPEDFKPHKWPDDLREEFGIECGDAYLALLRLMQEQFGHEVTV